MTDRTKKWLKFTVRWGIAALGVWWVLSNINFTDRVMRRDPVTGRPQYVAVLDNAKDNAREYRVQEKGKEPQVIQRSDLWLRPDRRKVDGRKVLAIRAESTASAEEERRIVEFLVEDPATGNGVLVKPGELSNPGRPVIESPDVEFGVTRMVREADHSYLIAALCILPIGYVLTSLRWLFLLRGLGVHIGLGRTFVINMVGAFYNSFMLGTTGGDVVKAYYAAKHTPLRTRAVMTVLIDRAIGLLALIVLGGAMAARQWHVDQCKWIAILCGIILTCALAGSVVFFNRALRRATGLNFVLRRLPMQTQVQKAVEAMEIYGRHPLPLVLATLVSFPVHAVSILSASFAGQAFGLKLSPSYYWVVVPVVALAGAIPISPQGAGVMEGMCVLLTRGRGATISQAFMLTMSIRLLQMAWNLVAGLFVVRGGYHAPTVKEQQELESDDAATPPSTASDTADVVPPRAGEPAV